MEAFLMTCANFNLQTNSIFSSQSPSWPFGPLFQMQYQRSWPSLCTGTSTTRSTWNRQWRAYSSPRNCTAGRAAWSFAAMPSNLYWDTTPSSRPWPRKACTSPTRTDWWLRGIWLACPYIWWVDALTTHKPAAGTRKYSLNQPISTS